jgi:hypothetical protein
LSLKHSKKERAWRTWIGKREKGVCYHLPLIG